MTTSFKELFTAIILTALIFILGILNAGAQTAEFPPVFIGDLFGYTLNDVNETSTTSQRRYEAKVKPSPWYGCTELYTFDRPDSVVLRFIAPSNTGLPYIDQFLGSYKKNADGTWMLSGKRTGSAKVLSSPVFAFLVDSIGNVLASSTVSDAIYSAPEYVAVHDTTVVTDTVYDASDDARTFYSIYRERMLQYVAEMPTTSESEDLLLDYYIRIGDYKYSSKLSLEQNLEPLNYYYMLAKKESGDTKHPTPSFSAEFFNYSHVIKDTVEVVVNDTIEVPRELSKRERYDVNGDGKINATDVVNIYNYIIHASAIQSKSFNLDDMLMDISGIGLPVDEQENVYYDVMGNKVINPTRGCIYIYNGQKVRY